MPSSSHFTRLRRHLARQIVAYVALAVALTGTASASGLLTGVDIQNGTITGRDIQRGTITGLHVRNGTIGLVDLSAQAKSAVRGARGERGHAGARGATGATGAIGARGPAGTSGTPGTPGTAGTPGANGTTGAIAYADFYALMPGDNASTVAPGTSVSFPQDGPRLIISRASASTFTLPSTGTYRVAFNVSVTEAGQLGISINGTLKAADVFGRATGTSLISGEALVAATAGDVLSITNPAGNATALTITPLAGGTQAAAAHLVIEQIA